MMHLKAHLKAVACHNTIMNTMDQTSKLVSSCHVRTQPSKQQTSYTIRVWAMFTPVQNSSANLSVTNDMAVVTFRSVPLLHSCFSAYSNPKHNLLFLFNSP
jgi:hypothetical protein